MAKLNIKKELGDKTGIATTLHNIAMIHSSLGEVQKALINHNKALEIYNELGNNIGIARCLNSIGIISSNQGQIQKALSLFHRVLKVNEVMGNKAGIASSLTNIGNVYFDQEEIKNALECHLKSLKISENLGDKTAIAGSLNNIGNVYNEQGEIKKALEFYHKTLIIREEVGDKAGIARCLNGIGTIYVVQGENEKAFSVFQKALKIDIGLGNQEGIANGQHHIGLLYDARGELLQAAIFGRQSLAISQEIGNPHLIKQACSLLSIVYKKTNNYKQALAMYELHIQMRDSINNESTQKAAIKQNMQYEYEKQHLSDSLETSKTLALKDIEISKQQAEAKAERTTKYGLFGGLGLVLIIALVLFRSVKQKKKANDEITRQKQEVEHKNREVLDSITYAERIQSAILPPMALMNETLINGFVLYKPKDIVAGDFYWMESIGDDIYFSAADCTGHGVPGAMMSVMCSNALTKCVKELGLTKPGEILDATTKIIEGRFERSEQMVLDGMDLALCKLNLTTMQLEYSGANNPLWIIREDEVLETKADKQPIGMYDDRKPYTNHQIKLQKGDAIYIFSDGFVDQFGGPKGKKLKSKPFKKLLLSIQEHGMDKQNELINEAFESWKGSIEQIDDVCVIGVGI